MGAPIGYKSSTAHGEKKNRPDESDPVVFKKLQRAWHEFAKGAYTKAEIRRMPCGWGVGNRNGGVMPAQSIDNLFRNSYCAGILVGPWSKEELQAQHVPMASQEVFAHAQRIIAKKSRSVPHIRHQPGLPLRGFVRCPNCQRHLTGSFPRGSGGRYPYYRCGNRDCTVRSKSISASVALQEFESLLSAIAPKPGMVEKLAATILRVVEKRERFAQEKSARTRDTLSQLDKETQELIRMRAQSIISDKEFLVQKCLLSERRAAVEIAENEDGFKAAELRNI